MIAIDEKKYAVLFGDIAQLCETMNARSKTMENRERLLLYWKMGNRILQDEQTTGDASGYGRALVKQLSRDLTRRFGPGYAHRTVYYARKFRKLYAKRAIQFELSWSHYKTLMSVKEESVRTQLATEAVVKGLSEEKLKALVRRWKGYSNMQTLRPRAGELFLYKVERGMRGGNAYCRLDCGFGVKRESAASALRGMPNGALVRCVAQKDQWRYLRSDNAPGSQYCYRASVVRVVDGDTLVLDVDLGHRMWVTQRFRLRGVNTPELDSAEGQAAAALVAERLPEGTRVQVLTYGTGRYGRYVADVFYQPDGRNRYPRLQQSRFLNMELIEAGYASA